MIEKTVKKRALNEHTSSSMKEDLAYRCTYNVLLPNEQKQLTSSAQIAILISTLVGEKDSSL